MWRCDLEDRKGNSTSFPLTKSLVKPDPGLLSPSLKEKKSPLGVEEEGKGSNFVEGKNPHLKESI